MLMIISGYVHPVQENYIVNVVVLVEVLDIYLKMMEQLIVLILEIHKLLN